jgi:hypothetical protein
MVSLWRNPKTQIVLEVVCGCLLLVALLIASPLQVFFPWFWRGLRAVLYRLGHWIDRGMEIQERIVLWLWACLNSIAIGLWLLGLFIKFLLVAVKEFISEPFKPEVNSPV